MQSSKLRNLLKENGLDAVLVSSYDNILYLTGFSAFSKEERDAYLLITKDSQYIFTNTLYTEAVKRQIQDFKLITVNRQQPMSGELKKLCRENQISTLGFEANDMTALEYTTLTKALKPTILKYAPFLTSNLRRIKNDDEIEKIKKACTLGDKAFTYILKRIKSGVTELELALELELYIRKNGGTLSFSTIVAFAENSAFPHHQPTTKKLTKNSFVLFDFGVKRDAYCSDMTRTVFFGTPTVAQKKMYETVLNSQQAAIDYVNYELRIKNHDIKLSDIDKTSRECIVNQGYSSIPHSLGHGIGIAVHEAPSLSPLSTETVEEGIVFSIEPGIYLLDVGGVRIEDLFAIQNNKLKQLTNSLRELIELKITQ